jgi:hypothetical protein
MGKGYDHVRPDFTEKDIQIGNKCMKVYLILVTLRK